MKQLPRSQIAFTPASFNSLIPSIKVKQTRLFVQSIITLHSSLQNTLIKLLTISPTINIVPISLMDGFSEVHFDDENEDYDYDPSDIYGDDPFDYADTTDYDQDLWMDEVDEDEGYVEPEVPNSQVKETHSYESYQQVTIKWIFIVLNVVIEVFQASFTQENALGIIRTLLYMKLSVITSSLCLMIALVEAIHEGKESKVVWQRRGYFGWFYYPGTESQRKLFGRFSLVFGVVSSMTQFCMNLVAVLINKNLVKFEPLPLMLSIGYLVAALVDHGGKDRLKV